LWQLKAGTGMISASRIEIRLNRDVLISNWMVSASHDRPGIESKYGKQRRWKEKEREDKQIEIKVEKDTEKWVEKEIIKAEIHSRVYRDKEKC